MHTVKRCSVCGRFRDYDAEDVYCVDCGHEGLESECGCGRRFDYLRDADVSTIHCPHCGKVLRGRQKEFDA